MKFPSFPRRRVPSPAFAERWFALCYACHSGTSGAKRGELPHLQYRFLVARSWEPAWRCQKRIRPLLGHPPRRKWLLGLLRRLLRRPAFRLISIPRQRRPTPRGRSIRNAMCHLLMRAASWSWRRTCVNHLNAPWSLSQPAPFRCLNTSLERFLRPPKVHAIVKQGVLLGQRRNPARAAHRVWQHLRFTRVRVPMIRQSNAVAEQYRPRRNP